MASVIPAPFITIHNEDGSTGLGALRDKVSLVISDVFCDMGAMTLSAPRNIDGMQHLLVDADRQVRVRLPGCPDQWFLADAEALTFISDDANSELVSLELRSLAGVLDEAKVTPSFGIGEIPNEWPFEDVTPGEIVEVLFTEAQSFGVLENITLAGSSTVDADGDSWPETYTNTYKGGTSLLEVLKSLADLKLIEWRMNARELEIYKPAGGLDRTLTTPFRPREDITSAPYKRDKKSIATDVLVETVNGFTVLQSQALTGRRRRMAFVSQSSAPEDAGAPIGDLFLAARSQPDVQMTHEITDGPTTPVPWVDYRCGDRVPTLAAGSGVTVQRIAQIALTYSGSGSSVTLEAGSVLASAEEIFDRKLRKLLPGDSN